jgi:hypothetical protein
MPKISVTLAASSQEWEAGITYVRKAYNDAFGLEPSDPDYLFVAIRGEVIGTLGIILPTSEGLEILSRHSLQPEIGSQDVELCRWSSSCAEVSALLIRAVMYWLESHHIKSAWCEQEPSVNRRARRFGIAFEHVPGSVNAAALTGPHGAFYRSRRVGLYRLAVPQTLQAINQYCKERSI